MLVVLTQDMKKWIIQLFVMAFLLGCQGERHGVLYIGYYSINCGKMEEGRCRAGAISLFEEIAQKVFYTRVVREDDRPGLIIYLYPKKPIPDNDALRLYCSYYSNTKRYNIGVLKNGACETDEIRRVRRIIEEVLGRHPEYKWKFEFSDRSVIPR